MWSSFLQPWIIWTGIGSTTIALIVLAIFFPAFSQIIANLLAPIAKIIGEWIALWMGDMVAGLRLMLSSVAGIIFVFSILTGSVIYGHYIWKPVASNCSALLKDLHSQYRFVPRTSKNTFNWMFDPSKWF